MGVAVGTDQRGDAHALAADIADEVAEDREAGDDVEAVLGVRGKRDRDQKQTDEAKVPQQRRRTPSPLVGEGGSNER